MTPINDLGTGFYLGFQGGLYPGGSNVRPANHAQAGLTKAQSIQPLNSSGNPDPNGKYAMLGIGMSNSKMEFEAFMDSANADPGKDPNLVIANGCISGATAQTWANPAHANWTTASTALAQEGVNDNQVVAVWTKLANNSGGGQSPEQYRNTLQTEIEQVIINLYNRFPNLKLVYMSSRTYGGYATTTLNPEPFAYESGFVTKWVVEDNLNSGQWVSWGPYFWADGLNARSDGMTWEQSDFRPDGTHPSYRGVLKVAGMMYEFFKTDATAKEWFLAGSSQPPPPDGVTTYSIGWKKFVDGVLVDEGDCPLP